MKTITLEQLLEAGCHFGHQVTRQNPKAREFIYQEREGIHVIDLGKTRDGLLAAAEFVKEQAAKGSTMLFIGTKRQAQGILVEEAKRAGVYYVSNRWVGGMLTNYEEVSKNFKKLKELRANLQDENVKSKYTKKEVGMWDKERIKLEGFYASVCDMEKLPDVVFIVDTHKEDLAVREASQKGIPIVGFVDTNSDPTLIDYPIPANDDAVGSLKLIISFIADAWLEGKGQLAKTEEKAAKDKEKADADAKKAEEKAKEPLKEPTKVEAKSEKTEEKPKVEKKAPAKKKATEKTTK